MELYKSQLGQDKWVLETLNYKKNGFYLEIGAADGVMCSNCYVLDKLYDWKGICFEPNKRCFKMLKHNRTALLVNELLGKDKGKEVLFHCGDQISFVKNNDHNLDINKFKKILQKGNLEYKSYYLKTRLISNILEDVKCPKVIDYISIDIEGMEYDVLSTFPFDKYHVNTITVEHNAPHIGEGYRMRLRKLLTDNNMVFVKGNDPVKNWNHGPIDDYYVNKNIII